MGQLNALDQVSQRQLVATIAGRCEAEQLGRSDVRDGELVLWVPSALLPVQLLGFVEEDIAQSCRIGIDARIALLSRRMIIVSIARVFWGHLDGKAGRKEMPWLHTHAKQSTVESSRGQQNSVLWATRSPRNKSASNSPRIGWSTVR